MPELIYVMDVVNSNVPSNETDILLTALGKDDVLGQDIIKKATKTIEQKNITVEIPCKMAKPT
ncbi:uncharacterized protein Z519_01550 [Cladophialophora bantiana CBS 173.52]|uniref:Uncharacterized protein n=1 Tax=Cladophialophora bantiana (strain ATCC 10958 / CBS 173.52 / CDC B-1940 / NIH 8579) TaxID=1442370 RepID=A0A0D2F7A6_CLAB1|nr:uncharacterized protein Z519_01550 [Cladophialophora bantiana CBS 173.52]KIW97966.1 hypothetical protein Z519_01550 [Cladophialophora bantiana CBS 173.52]